MIAQTIIRAAHTPTAIPTIIGTLVPELVFGGGFLVIEYSISKSVSVAS
jgi:hypothetical protein|tara:strand:+ start:264 stop:410 length:147 start_codon:yes stop_codon:yes gene_type:complete